MPTARQLTLDGTRVKYSAGMIWSVSMLSFTTKQAPVYLVGLALFFGISFSRGSMSSDAAAWRATLD